MTKKITEIVNDNKEIINELLKKEGVDFLSNLYTKQEKINNEINDTKAKKEQIIDELLKNEGTLDKDNKELREHINSLESVLESIEIVYKNLSELQSTYINIENRLLIIIERIRSNIDIKEEIEILSNKINFAISCENNIKNDNEKNYLIINSSLKRTINKTIESNVPTNLENITIDNLTDNLVLKIFEKRVELPYTKKEVENFMKEYPNEYKTVQDVISKEFIVHISLYNKHPILSRFREAYYLCRIKEMQSVFDSFMFAKSIMFRSDINPYIIAAVKTKKQLEDYIECLEQNRLDDYKYFKIVFAVNPLAV